MFPRRYFPGRHFAHRYWPAPVGPLAVTPLLLLVLVAASQPAWGLVMTYSGRREIAAAYQDAHVLEAKWVAILDLDACDVNVSQLLADHEAAVTLTMEG